MHAYTHELNDWRGRRKAEERIRRCWLAVAEILCIHECVRDILRFVVGVDAAAAAVVVSFFCAMYSYGLYGRQMELQ